MEHDQQAHSLYDSLGSPAASKKGSLTLPPAPSRNFDPGGQGKRSSSWGGSFLQGNGTARRIPKSLMILHSQPEGDAHGPRHSPAGMADSSGGGDGIRDRKTHPTQAFGPRSGGSGAPMKRWTQGKFEEANAVEHGVAWARPLRNWFLLDVLRDRGSRSIFLQAAAALLIGMLVYHWLEGWSLFDAL